MAERLRTEASAYLRQHAENPVDWWPFSDEAFNEARRRDVPVFISVGYAACHWCHVMAHESFEDAAVAGYLNRHFVSIKVDREERPDVDAVYMAATQTMTGQGGWPMSVFTLPDGRAFFAGTYFPPSPIRGAPSFRQVLEAVQDAWTHRRTEVEQSADQLAGSLGEAQRRSAGLLLPRNNDDGASPLEDALPAAVAGLAAQEDPVHGGFGDAPKFPPSSSLAFLLARARSDDPGGQAAALAARTLEAMAGSGMHDLLGGGFARYAVDAAWAVPHFEKMLYDNAQLIRVYARWAVQADSPESKRLAERVARGAAGWLERELAVDGGAFASSLDADTVIDGARVEGGTYTWTRDQLRKILGNRAEAVLDLFDVRAGSVESGAFTLHAGRSWSTAEWTLWDEVAPSLLSARNERPQPARDEKVVAGWNGLAVGSLAEAGALLEDPALLAMAERAAAYLLEVHWDGTQLRRVSHRGRAVGIDGLLEDYAGVVDGLQALYAATGDLRWYQASEQLLERALCIFVRPDGTVVDAGTLARPLLAAQAAQQAADPFDNAAPSGIALLAGALVTSAAYNGSAERRGLAEKLLAHVSALASRAPRAIGWALAVAQAAVNGPQEVAVVGPPGSARERLAATARRRGKAGIALAVGEGNESAVPLLTGRRTADDGGPLAYVCEAMVCRRPVSEPEELAALLGRPSGEP
ncbi:thioredoxin domain-containing protein [Arthrobacter tecti]